MKTSLTVEGMTCNGCVNAVRTKLERMEGVGKAAVSLEAKAADVEYDDSKITVEQMVAAINGLGYNASHRS